MENIINKKHNILSDVNFELHAPSKEVLRRQHSKDSVTVNNDKGSHSSFCRTRRAALEVTSAGFQPSLPVEMMTF